MLHVHNKSNTIPYYGKDLYGCATSLAYKNHILILRDVTVFFNTLKF